MIKRMISFVIISMIITFGIAFAMILSQPAQKIIGGEGLDFTQTLARAGQEPMPQQEVIMRDGFPLQLRHYPSAAPDAPLLVVVHGSGWHGLQFDAMARALSTQAEVLVPDLRGHGAKPGRRGDIDYIGQFEDDLADLIAQKRKGTQKLIMIGHSSGGGLVTRFAGGEHGQMMDAAVLLAPFLKHNAPTTRVNAGGWAHALRRRIIGLSILNTFGIRALNHLTILQLNMPKAVLDGPLGATATTGYSYRLNTSFAPRSDYLSDVAALPPFLVIAGIQDEAFLAQEYEPTMAPANPTGQYVLLPDVGHLDVVNDPRTYDSIKGMLDGV